MSILSIYSSKFSRKSIPPGFYLYAYLDQNGFPYYIGKGVGIRAWAIHENVTRPSRDHIVIIESNLTEIGAWALERRLVSLHGRVDEGNGILLNRSTGGPGCRGSKTQKTTEHKRKISETLKAKCRTTVIPGGGTKGRVWINNGIDRKCIMSSDPIPEGYTLGKGTCPGQSADKNSVYGLKLYNDGSHVKYFAEGTQPLGWVRGRI